MHAPKRKVRSEKWEVFLPTFHFYLLTFHLPMVSLGSGARITPRV